MKRSFPVTLIQLTVLIILISNVISAWTVLAWRDVLTEFSASLPPIVAAIIGGVWVVTGCTLFWGIWQAKVWAGKMLLGAAISYTFWYWSERLFFQNPRPNTIFAVIVNLGLFIIIYYAIKSMSREAYERENENPVIE
ncbi:MAG: hypothetical protein IPO22_21030 [Anaerolineales bacterium]|jgi:hypothetical protein|nr:hypothetical protein [Anaerolineales bacterium]